MTGKLVPLFFALSVVAPPGASVASARTPHCHTSELRIYVVRLGAAAGTVAGDLGFRNVGSKACFVYGYPGLGLEDAHHRVKPSSVTWGSTVARRDPRSHHVALVPGKAAYANFSYGDVPVGNEHCRPSAWLEVTPPDERTHRLVPFRATVCNHGHLTVTALSATRTR